MKKLYLFVFVALSAMLFASCSGVQRLDKRNQLMVLPDTVTSMKMADGYVDVNFKLVVPQRYVRSQSCVTFTPVIVGESNRLYLEPIIIKGREFARMEERRILTGEANPLISSYMLLLPDYGATNFNYTARVPYAEWMNNSVTVLKEDIYVFDEFVNIATYPLFSGVMVPVQEEIIILTPAPQPKPKKPEIKSESGEARLYYKINSSAVDPNLDNNREQLNKMESLLRNVMNDRSKEVKSIDIYATSSPDGNYASNEKLAEARAYAIKNYLARDMKLPNSDLINVRWGVASWNDILPYVMDSPLSESAKSQIERIVNNASSPAQANAQLRALPSFSYLRTNVLPQLRKVTYTINYTVKEYND